MLQWNCDHLMAKIPELEVSLQKYNVDVALIQETKLRAEDGSVRVRGYDVVRRDRWRGEKDRWSRGGGLVTLVRNGWGYRKREEGVPRDGVVEALWVEVVSPGGGVWQTVNVYVPPENRGRVGEGALGGLEAGGEGKWLVAGDFNAHHIEWDERSRGDARGEELVGWADDRELAILNDGSVTRRGRGSQQQSSPDVSLVSRELAEGLSWEVVREMGSDHFPILIKRRGKREETKEGRQLVWDWKRANWEEYKEEVRRGIRGVQWESISVTEAERRFRRVVLRAARRKVGRILRQQEDRLVGAGVRELMRGRDELLGGEEIDWERVEAMEGDIREAVKEEKRGRWRSLLAKGASAKEMWKVVNGAKAKEGPRCGKGEVMEEGDRVMVSAREKAEGFVRVYERVSRVKVPRGRGMKKRVNELLRRAGPETEEGAEITLHEVKEALRQMEGGKAAGPEGVHPRLLKQLPEEALEVVRGLFERSVGEARVPQCWRVGEIIPLLKVGKDPSAVGSYRPVCLTACLGKWLERVLAARMRWMLEGSGWFSCFQAGFREGKGVNDQLVRLSQSVWDGWQERLKTCLMLYDFERAYDRVWHDGLLLKLIEAGVSRRLVRWVQVWLSNRLAWVKVEGVRSRARRFQQGLPQGSVLSPLLFLVYINDLVEELAAGEVQVSAFADDLAVWSTSRTVGEGRRRLQQASDVVMKWSEEWLMRVSVEKCSVTVFSTDRRDKEMAGLEVVIAGREVRKEQFPCFLGVIYDTGFTFREQVEKVVRKAKGGVRLLRRLAGRDWGWAKGLLRTTCVALVRAVMLYGSAAWAPWVTKSVWEKVERVQLEAARVVGGTLRSAPREAVLVEAGLCPVKTVAEGLWMAEMEKCLRAEEGDPRREWGLRRVRKRLVRRVDWRTCAGELMEKVIPPDVERTKCVEGRRPWEEWKGVWWDVEAVRGKDEESCRKEALERIERWGTVDVAVYTDGAAVEGVRNGGAAAVITKGDPRSPTMVEERVKVAGRVASSFQAEMCALEVALEWLWENVEEWRRAMIVSDSMSGLLMLRDGGARRVSEVVGRVMTIGRKLGEMGKELIFVWVPGHCGLVGNEWADGAAGRVSQGEQEGGKCSFESVRSLWKRRERVVVLNHERCRKVYERGVRWEVERGWERSDSVRLARLRSGHSTELAGYVKRIGLGGSGLCRRCGLEEESVEHVMECAAGELKRIELGLNGVSDLCCRAAKAIVYWKWWVGSRLS